MSSLSMFQLTYVPQEHIETPAPLARQSARIGHSINRSRPEVTFYPSCREQKNGAPNASAPGRNQFGAGTKMMTANSGTPEKDIGELTATPGSMAGLPLSFR
ncbi:hypothetical protein [Devosia marina]|uniref:hypothetical protein n=1 Tax=Devosia marina TaxID=2683198 RepID=UPI003D9A6043